MTDVPQPASSANSPKVIGAPPKARSASTTRCRASVNWLGTTPPNRYTRRVASPSINPGARVASRSIAGSGVSV